ncbi:hypothetical protein Pth03_77960 [Planotetraspora thailandica]|uniref:Uncharacterized protein n=1 Tax=Planotetraspora thailandica TaxID=487172 RepID=A0A8J3Y1Z8_9ACTN|nr:hypothetical protein [Planotetraspora thailandica]GII59407.1 hypothetical protein Pth03_77960 [Planotetraspora thailandica]
MSSLIKQGRGRSGLSKAPEGDPAAPPPEIALPEPRPGEASPGAGGVLAAPGEAVERLREAVPRPYEPVSDGDLLGAQERRDLTTCEAALEHLRLAFWVAGRALQVIRDARLYREAHATFEDYCLDRWSMSRPQAYRLISEWSLAERLLAVSPMGDKVSERHVRELLPVATVHGDDAAELVYATVAQADGVRVTAELLRDVVAIVPTQWDPAAAVLIIREFLDRDGQGDGGSVGRRSPFQTQTTRVRTGLADLATRLRKGKGGDPEQVRAFVADARRLLDQIEQSMS